MKAEEALGVFNGQNKTKNNNLPEIKSNKVWNQVQLENFENRQNNVT